MEEVLKRYYKGETTLAEERELRSAWQRGELPGEPILGLRDPMEIPEGLNENRIPDPGRRYSYAFCRNRTNSPFPTGLYRTKDIF